MNTITEINSTQFKSLKAKEKTLQKQLEVKAEPVKPVENNSSIFCAELSLSLYLLGNLFAISKFILSSY